MFAPYITGDWSSANMTWEIGKNGGLALASSGCTSCLVGVRDKVVATFAPEYKDTVNDTKMALRSAALFSSLVYVLLPLGVGGTLGTALIAADDTLIAFYTTAFDPLVGASSPA